MPMFSVIVPIYNVEKYLKQCVESILNQTYKNFELILVDDGSFDNCPAICDRYEEKDDRVRVIHKTNGGLVSARKAGALVATGDYVVCVDGDDWVDEQCLEHYALIMQNYSPDLIVSVSVAAFEDETQNRTNSLPYRKGYYDKEHIKNEIYPLLIQNEYANYFVPTIWAKAYRANLYKKQQLAVSNQIKIGEDGACTIPYVYHAESLYITDAVTYYYRQNPSSMTKVKKAFSWSGPELIHKHIQNQVTIDEWNFREQLYRKTAHELFTVVVTQFNRNESYNTVVKDIKKNLKSEIYAESIKKAKFKSLNGKMAVFAMKYGIWFLIKVYSKIHSF
jgi:glycosyltransferase involved in cell wall biosynthesis